MIPAVPLDPKRLRIPDTHTLDDCIRYWDHGDIQKGLLLPLKDWPTMFKPSSYRSEAVKLGKIKIVVHEFREIYKSDHKRFERQYPGLLGKYSKLIQAINTVRRERGELTERRRKGHVNVRAPDT